MQEYMSSQTETEGLPINSYQRPLFLEVEDTALTWQDYDQDKNQGLLAMAGNVGPHSVVSHRAERLILTMNALAHRNMLMGLGVAGPDPELNDDILDRYGKGLPMVLGHSEKKVDRLYREAFINFCHATGYEALRGTGLTRGFVKKRIGKMWRDFRHDVGHPKVHKDLAKLRRTQEKFLPLDHPLREENRLARYKKQESPETLAA